MGTARERSDGKGGQALRDGVAGEMRSGCERCGAGDSGPPLIHALFSLHHLMMRLGDRLTQPHGLTASRWMLLCSLQRRGETATVSELADEQVMSVQGISRMLVTMEGEGLVSKETRPGHGRAVFVSLTERGREAVATLERLGDGFRERFLEGLGEDEIERMESDMSRLIGNLSRYEEELIRGGETPAGEECA